MLSFKFNLFFLFLFLSLPSFAVTSFSAKECLEANFETEIRHDAQPFGLAQRILGLKKEGCLIQLKHEKLKFVKKAWEIDVCRGPIHIKSGAGAVSVSRRQSECSEVDDSSFCQDYSAITKILQNDGLIFAEGEKEDIEAPHGMVYCTYLLIEKYLLKGNILSRHDQSFSVIEEKRDEQEQEPLELAPQNLDDEEEFPESEEPVDF